MLRILIISFLHNSMNILGWTVMVAFGWNAATRFGRYLDLNSII